MMKKPLFILVLLGLTAGAFAQMSSEYNGRPDKKNNAIFFSNGLQCKYREDVQGAIRNFETALHYMPNDDASMYELSEPTLPKACGQGKYSSPR